MAQISYDKEVVLQLIKSPNHIRGLAKDLSINQMTIQRKMKELEKANIVDFSQQGRNKVYFLKKSIESEEFVYICEHYNLMRFVEKHPKLRNFVDKIRKHPGVSLALLFGSYVKGLEHKDSDIDLYVETTNRKLKKEIEDLHPMLSVKIGKYESKSLLIQEILKNHIIIKGVEYYYARNEFFS
jgi:predicted nucleotidyltransferase